MLLLVQLSTKGKSCLLMATTRIRQSQHYRSTSIEGDVLFQLQDVPNPTLESALSNWQQGHKELPPSGAAWCRQNAWDVPQIQASLIPSWMQHPTKAPTHICWQWLQRNPELGWMLCQCYPLAYERMMISCRLLFLTIYNL